MLFCSRVALPMLLAAHIACHGTGEARSPNAVTPPPGIVPPQPSTAAPTTPPPVTSRAPRPAPSQATTPPSPALSSGPPSDAPPIRRALPRGLSVAEVVKKTATHITGWYSVPRGPDVVRIEVVVSDRRFELNRKSWYGYSTVEVEIVVHTSPPQRRRIGRIRDVMCQLPDGLGVISPDPAMPTHALFCFFAGWHAGIAMNRVDDTRVRVVAYNGQSHGVQRWSVADVQIRDDVSLEWALTTAKDREDGGPRRRIVFDPARKDDGAVEVRMEVTPEPPRGRPAKRIVLATIPASAAVDASECRLIEADPWPPAIQPTQGVECGGWMVGWFPVRDAFGQAVMLGGKAPTLGPRIQIPWREPSVVSLELVDEGPRPGLRP